MVDTLSKDGNRVTGTHKSICPVGPWMRFTHTDRVLAKVPHTTNEDAVEYTEDMYGMPGLHVSYRQTHVEVYQGTDLLYKGTAICWAPDRFTKAIGRRNALLNALKEADRDTKKFWFDRYNQRLGMKY
jgi:hypothetical protein